VYAISQYLNLEKYNQSEIERYYELVTKVANFYVSRSKQRTREPSTPTYYDIDLIVPPDEYAINVNNSVFTNAMAQISNIKYL
jgi:trehalose/maltose hydrolase-like predicted phosphorylase